MSNEKDRRLAGKTGRDLKTGRFVQGNPGRRVGALNKSSIDARTLRARIVESWTRVEADEKLDQLAAEDFPTYLKVVASLLPKQTEAEIRAKDVRRMTTAELMEHVQGYFQQALDKGVVRVVDGQVIAGQLGQLPDSGQDEHDG
jgi:hypothetical protein